MTNHNDFLAKINFELSSITARGRAPVIIMDSWSNLVENLLKEGDFGQIIYKAPYLKETVDEITKGLTDPTEKVKAIYKYVKNNITWDGWSDFTASEPKKVLELKKGTSGDINLLLASMLAKADLDVDMILLSTRSHGFIRKESPMRKQFNYVICTVYIGDKTLFLDATEKNLPMNILPERCLNGDGLIVSTKRNGWIMIKAGGKTKTNAFADFAVDSQGGLKGQLSVSRTGYDASKMRTNYEKAGQGDYVKGVISTNWSVDKIDIASVSDIDQPVVEKYDLTIGEHATVAGDVIYINPIVAFKEKENPFKADARLYPIDFGAPYEKVFTGRFAIPEGYIVDELPKSQIFMMPENAARYVYNINQTGQMISITSSFQMNKNLFIQTEYLDLREFYNHVLAKQEEQIVLKKK